MLDLAGERGVLIERATLGRMLIALLFHGSGMLTQPLLYLSLQLGQNRSAYNALLDGVRIHADWEAWVEFFLEGVEQQNGSG